MVSEIFNRSAVSLIVTVCLVLTGSSCVYAGAKEKKGSDLKITAEEIAEAPVPTLPEDKGEHFTIGSYKDDVERIQGEPDEKYFDGSEMVWYYGKDAVYFDIYGRVNGVDNKSGNLKVD